MLTYVVRRILYSIPVVLIASALVFVFVRETTNPLARLSQVRDPSAKTELGLRIGLYKRPCHDVSERKVLVCTKTTVFEQYGVWLKDFAHGRLGTSNVSGRPVSKDLRAAFGKTIQLILWGVGLAALIAIFIGVYSAIRQYSMLDVMSSDYIRTARAKGLPRRTVVLKHGLRNALIPLVTVMAVDIGALFGGLIITEQIFSIPGMGKLFVDALTNGDTNVLLGWMMVTAVFIILFNLLADVLYGILDPRVRLA